MRRLWPKSSKNGLDPDFTAFTGIFPSQKSYKTDEVALSQTFLLPGDFEFLRI